MWLRDLPRWRRILAKEARYGTTLWDKVEFLDRWVGYLQTDGSISYADKPAKLSYVVAQAVQFRYLQGLSREECAERLQLKPMAVDRYCQIAVTQILSAIPGALLQLGEPYEDSHLDLAPAGGLVVRPTPAEGKPTAEPVTAGIQRKPRRKGARQESAQVVDDALASILSRLDDKRRAILVAMESLPNGSSLQQISTAARRMIDRRDMSPLLTAGLVEDVERQTPPPLGYVLTHKGRQSAAAILTATVPNHHQEVNVQ